MASAKNNRPAVLVVDDNHDLADNVAELLREEGADTTVAYSAVEARDRMRGGGCDLAVIDIRMPDTGGISLLVEIKEHCPEAEVIMMTANASVHTATSALHEGAFAYLEKPFDPQQLLTLSKQALAQIGLRQERARLQDALRHSEALYREVVDGVDALIVGVDGEGVLRMCNQRAVETLGYARSALLGRQIGSLSASKAVRVRLAQSIQAARAAHKQSDVELSLKGADGSERITRWTFSLLEPMESKEALVLGVGLDLTDRVDLERRAAEAEAMASLATLTAGLAHEIRNPLNAAALQLNLLQRATRKLDENDAKAKIDKRVAIVESELSRLTNLLDDFLRLAKPQRLQLVPVSLRELLTAVHALEEPATKQAGHSLILETCDDDLYALGDQATLTQVLVNLIVNASDALIAQPDGEITLRAAAQGRSRVGIEVIDDGPGVPVSVAQSLFTPFVTSKEAGTGLGLTVVKRIIDRHGGTIQIVSPTTGGTAARITLPRARGPIP